MIFVATPYHRATKVDVDLLTERVQRITFGYKAVLKVVGNCPWLDCARADLVYDFLDGDADDLFFIDDDIDIDRSVFIRMMYENKPIVIAPYRTRLPPNDWAVVHNGKDVIAAGLGCTLIKREVIEVMVDQFPELIYDQDGHQQSALFLHTIVNDKLLKEDHAFFYRANQCGFPIHALDKATVNHNGTISTWESLQ